MKKQKFFSLLLSCICIIFLIGTLVNVVDSIYLIKSSMLSSSETYKRHLRITKKLDSFYKDGVKYVKAKDADKLLDGVLTKAAEEYDIAKESLDTYSKPIGIISDFSPKFRKYIYSVNARVGTLSLDKNIISVYFTTGEKFYFIPENLKEQYE